jgi:LCP family protein required for cell wall assembly
MPPYSAPPMQGMTATRPPYAPRTPPPLLRRKQKRRFPIWARVALALVVLVVLIIGGLFTYYGTQIAPSLNGIIGYHAIHNDGPAQDYTPLSDQNRINILLLGSDTDGKNGAPLAQTDIIVTINQQTHAVGMLSIPRDLQVDIPSNGPGKMDAAFSLGWIGEGSNNSITDTEAAAGLAEDTIQHNFGIHIDRYAWVGLQGFVNVTNTVGGVDVDITHPMVDDDYPDDIANPGGNVYDYQRLSLDPGPQHLDGVDALEYVRTRHSDLIGDFGRSARQQQVLKALEAKLATPATLTQLPQLAKDLNESVLTDMQFADLAFLANFARGVNLDKIQQVTLSPPYSTPSSQNTNYLPNCPQIETIIAQMFGIQPTCIPQTD